MDTLEALYPATVTRVIDVLSAAGVDTSAWTGPDDPFRRNNWSFGEPGEPQVLFIWHNELYLDGDRVCYRADMQEHAIQLERVNTPTTRSQARRAREFHGRVTRAYFQKRPLRVALVDGTIGEDGVGKVRTRVLDNALWYPHRRDPDTACVTLVRGLPLAEDFDPSAPYVDANERKGLDGEPPAGVDEAAQWQTNMTTTFARDSEVVRQAKTRAAGVCEHCGQPGFAAADGTRYLEGHHVIPLGCGGPDALWNVAALCADDHRRAHFSVDRIAIRTHLLALLGQRYPEHRNSLLEHAARMDKLNGLDERLEAEQAT
jgi:hypothetical protein